MKLHSIMNLMILISYFFQKNILISFLESIEENDEYKELSQHLIRNKKEVKALKRIEKILKEVSE